MSKIDYKDKTHKEQIKEEIKELKAENENLKTNLEKIKDFVKIMNKELIDIGFKPIFKDFKFKAIAEKVLQVFKDCKEPIKEKLQEQKQEERQRTISRSRGDYER